jgi:hypothetical protein
MAARRRIGKLRHAGVILPINQHANSTAGINDSFSSIVPRLMTAHNRLMVIADFRALRLGC